jgi:hypothetical protein
MAGHLLGPLEGRVNSLCPTDREVVFVLGSADLVQRLQHCGNIVRKAVLGCHVVQRARQPAFGACAVVAECQDDERVVGVRTLAHGLQYPADLFIGLNKKPAKTSICRAYRRR